MILVTAWNCFLLFTFIIGLIIGCHLFLGITPSSFKNKVMYFTKLSFYYAMLFMSGLILLFYFILTCKFRNQKNCKYAMTCLKIIGKCLGHQTFIQDGYKMPPSGNFIIVSNHQSSIDLLSICFVWPENCTFISKRSLLYTGPFGLSAWLSGTIFVSRGKASALEDLRRNASRLATDEELRIWIFPEGTRLLGDSIGPFKKGAFHMAVQGQVPIVPVVLSSYSNFYSKNDKLFDRSKVILRVLDPIPTTGLQSTSVSALTESVRRSMEKVYAEVNQEVPKITK